MRELVERAAALLPRLSPQQFYEEVVRRISEHALGVFVGYQDGQPKTLLIAELPTSAFQLAPVVVLAYHQGAERALVIATARRLREWLISFGFKNADVLNLRHTDRSMCRGCAHFGTPERIGSVIRFTLEASGD